MAKTVKEKNIIKFYLDDSKPENFYALDINTGILYGIKGSRIMRTPNGMNRFMDYNATSCVLRFMRRTHNWESIAYSNFSHYAKYLQICDKLDSIGYNHSHDDTISRSLLDFVNEHFKEFVQYLATDFGENERHTLSNFRYRCEESLYIKENKVEVSEYFPIEWVRYLIGCRFATAKQNACAIYYFKRGMYIALDRSCESLLKNFFYYCDKLGKDYPKGDFIREYATIKKEYEFRKTELDNQALYENQMKKAKALTFTDGNLIAIIPTTTEEFLDEANSQNNCVARMYMPKVIDNLTNIVFIRRISNPEKSYITCEVRNGEIKQYLGKNNRRLYDDDEAIAFKELFAKHLSQNW